MRKTEMLDDMFVSALTGQEDFLDAVGSKHKVQVHIHGSKLILDGDKANIEKALDNFEALWDCFQDRGEIYLSDLHFDDAGEVHATMKTTRTTVKAEGVLIKPRNKNQALYLDTVANKEVTFSLGPAGTGKTFLAVASAVQAFQNREVKRIVLTRPVVEAGEKLGFLPGTLEEKIDPYLKPLLDALQDMIPAEQLKQMRETGQIEIAPLAYMRGRTLRNSFVILDEAQNTTPQQLKMFLTRLGENSKFVVTGDPTQTDLPLHGGPHALTHAKRLLGKIERIGWVEFERKDIVRHSLVTEIVEAYEEDDQAQV